MALDSYTDVKPTVTNLWGELVYRKTADRPFVIPVDHVVGRSLRQPGQCRNYRKVVRSRNYPFVL